MIRLAELWELSLPELTEEEIAALDKISIVKIMEEVIAQLPIEERRCWKVTDVWGNTIKRFKTKEEALKSAIERNNRAEAMGLWMRYKVDMDQGYDE